MSNMQATMKNANQKPGQVAGKLTWISLAVALISGLIGFIGFGNDIVDGLGKAMFGVFLIIFFLFYLAEYKDI
jgi:uncharacterized membrane protein YtjA (UPF0391 family)